jgi:hypothetical protein
MLDVWRAKECGLDVRPFSAFLVISGRTSASSSASRDLRQNDAIPAWSPDGRQIAFTSERSGVRQIYRKNSDGGGQYILYQQYSPMTATDLWALPLVGTVDPAGCGAELAGGVEKMMSGSGFAETPLYSPVRHVPSQQ